MDGTRLSLVHYLVFFLDVGTSLNRVREHTRHVGARKAQGCPAGDEKGRETGHPFQGLRCGGEGVVQHQEEGRQDQDGGREDEKRYEGGETLESQAGHRKTAQKEEGQGAAGQALKLFRIFVVMMAAFHIFIAFAS